MVHKNPKTENFAALFTISSLQTATPSGAQKSTIFSALIGVFKQGRLSPRGHGAFSPPQDGRMGPPIFDYNAP